MALKIGSTTIGTDKFIDFNGASIAKVFVTSPSQTVTFQGDLPGTNKPVSGSTYTPQFSFSGDVRSYQKSMSYSDTSGGLYSCNFHGVEYNSSIDTTIFTYKITGTNLHTMNYTYAARLTISLPETLVWSSTATDLVVVVQGYYNPESWNTDVGFAIHNMSNLAIVGFKAKIVWDDGISELYTKTLDFSSTTIPAWGTFETDGEVQYLNTSTAGIAVTIYAYYTDGSKTIETDSIYIENLKSSSNL